MIMNDTTETTPTETPVEVAPEVAPEAAAVAPRTDFRRGGRNASADRRGGAGNNARRSRTPRREERARPEYDQKIISIRRVTRVMAGGRRFTFSVAMVAGNKAGRVGVGIGKAGDTQLAIEKAFRSAKKNMITVPLTKAGMIRHDVEAKYSSSVLMIMPAKGKGLVAGSSVRSVLELAGVKDVTAKIFSRSKNKLNNARAAIKALGELRS